MRYQNHHPLKQYADGTFEDGNKFSIEVTPGFLEGLFVDGLSRHIGKKVVTAKIAFHKKEE
jgi:hypothetical protein